LNALETALSSYLEVADLSVFILLISQPIQSLESFKSRLKTQTRSLIPARRPYIIIIIIIIIIYQSIINHQL